MEELKTNNFLAKILNSSEIETIPKDVKVKLEKYLDKQFEEYLTSKAIGETSKTNYNDARDNFERQVSELTYQIQDYEDKLGKSRQCILNLRQEITNLVSEKDSLQELSKSYTNELCEVQNNKTNIAIERDTLLRTIEKQTAEIERLQSEIRTNQNQLKSAIAGKCEALVRCGEIESKESALDMKEKRMEQERVIYTNQLQSLSEDLNRNIAELQNIRRENTIRNLQLQTKLNEKSEELKISNSQISHLKETVESMTLKAQEISSKLLAQSEESNRIIEYYKKELNAKSKLTELYKRSNEDKVSETKELEIAVCDLKKMLTEATEQYGELETNLKSLRLKHAQDIEEKQKIIEQQKNEIKNANDLLKEFQNESLEHALEKLAPSASVVNKLIKSNMTLTEVYTLYVKSTEENDSLKRENARINLQIKTILHELEERAPVIKKQELEYQKLMESNNELSHHLESVILEKSRNNQDLNDTCSKLGQLERENKQLKVSQNDLGRQVCYLLKEVEQIRSGLASENNVDSFDVSTDQVISKKLVTFSSISELHENNQKLLLLVRDLSYKLEQIETVQANINEAAYISKIEVLKKKLSTMQASFEDQTRMLNTYVLKCENLKKMYFDIFSDGSKNISSLEQIDLSEVENVLSRHETSSIKADNENTQKRIVEQETLVTELRSQLKKIRDEFEEYVQEKKQNDKLMNEQFDSMRYEVRDLTATNCKLKSTIDYNNEQLKIQAKNIDTYKKQITALEDRKGNYEASIIKQEEAIYYLKDEALNAQKKLVSAEIQVENLKQECGLLRNAESRLQLEREALHREKQTQNLLLNNLEMIKVSFERSEIEGKTRLESRLDESNRELSALRRRLQEEQDNFRELSNDLKHQSKILNERMENEKNIADQLRKNIAALEEKVETKSKLAEDLSQKLQESLTPNKNDNPIILSNKKARELEVKLEEAKLEIESLNKEIEKTREHANQYRNISESVEKELKHLYEIHKQYTSKTETELETLKSSELSLKSRISELETDIKLQFTTAQINNENNPADLKKIQEEYKIYLEKLSDANREIRNLRDQNKSLSTNLQTVEQKYANEMMLHSADIQELTNTKEELTKIKDQCSSVDTTKDLTIRSYEESRKIWADMEQLLRSEKDELEKRVFDLDKQNSFLHEQLQNLSTKQSLLNDSEANISHNDTSVELNISAIEIEERSNGKLLDIIKFLRKEKDIAWAKTDILKSENVRLLSEHSILQRKIDELSSFVNDEKTKSETEIVTAFRHEEILRKVEMLNAITDSNRVLREERDILSTRVKELTEHVNKIEDEIYPLKEKIRELTTKNDTLTTENTSLRTETVKWRQRATLLIDKNNKNPEEFRRLQNERENLAKMLTAEKESLKLTTEELASIKVKKSQIDSELTILQKQLQTVSDEKKKLADDLIASRAHLNKEIVELKNVLVQKEKELQKASDDLDLKEAQLVDSKSKEVQIRKIAKRYKDSYFELKDKTAPTNEENTVGESSNVQGNEDADLREKVLDLTQQLKNMVEGNEKLQKDNDDLKAAYESDEKTTLLREARTRIIHVTQAKDSIAQELSNSKKELELLKQNIDNQDTVINSIKTKYEEALFKAQKDNCDQESLHKENIARLTRENENLQIRITQLNRQLGIQQASKPSTSAVIPDKNSTESPRTANVKPMAGTIGQQSATVTPWRGSDTPLASIRPISVQNSRTAAILPTSQSSLNVIQSSGGSMTALVPPQQQVHTTGNNIEPMSSSPTSSHTDYMPATSSAAIVVAAILPMGSSAESSQEAESITSLNNESQVVVAGIQQQTIALVSPRIENVQNIIPPQLQAVEFQQELNIQPSTSGTSNSSHISSHHASSSNNVTTTHAGGHKRPRDLENENLINADESNDKGISLNKRTRLQLVDGTASQGNVTESGLEVEYQVPTSSQRDQEYDIVIVDSEEDDGISDEGNAEIDEGNVEDRENDDYDENYEQNPDMDEDDGLDIDQSNVQPENREVDMRECSGTGNQDHQITDPQSNKTNKDNKQQIQTISSGSGETENISQTSLWRQNTPLSRQQQATLIMLQKGCNEESALNNNAQNSYNSSGSQKTESSTNDLIVPHSNITQGSEDLRAEDDQLFSEEEAIGADAGFVQPSLSEELKNVSSEEGKINNEDLHINVISTEKVSEVKSPTRSFESSDNAGPSQSSLEGQNDVENVIEEGEGVDSVTSEGEKSLLDEEDMEEGREAEASTSSMNTRSKNNRGMQSNRRSPRGSHRGGRPTPIVWQDPMRGPPHNMRGQESPLRSFSSTRGQRDDIGRRGRRMRRQGGSNHLNMRY